MRRNFETNLSSIRLLLIALVGTLAACEHGELCDRDRDGLCPPADCDDRDPSVGTCAPQDETVPPEDGDDDATAAATPAGDDDVSPMPTVAPTPTPGPVDGDGDGWTVPGTGSSPGDCDDRDPASYPGAIEVCDGKDNDCDSGVDEDVLLTFYPDADGDGHGDGSASTRACEPPEGYVASGDDCDDTDPERCPGLEEVCDDKDNDCDGVAASCWGSAWWGLGWLW